MHWYSTKEIKYLREIVPGHSHKEITAMFNEHFSLNLSVEQLKGTISRYKMNTGRDGRFRPGLAPHNKGKKKMWAGGEETQFQKGHQPWNYKTVGTERVNTDGYVDVKIADPNKWRAKHKLIWEAARGPIPQGYVLIFADGNPLNVQLDNLLMITRSELAMLNKYGLISPDAELTKTGITIADIHLRISERKRGAKKKGAESND